MNFCGWQDMDCNTCPYYDEEIIHCTFEDEFIPLIKWLYSLMKERCRGNIFGWGTVYRYYYGNKEVYEFLINDFPYEYKQKFWELWRDGGNQAFKKLGFGVFKDRDYWILFWEIKFKDILFEILQEKETKIK